jgi:hypothetical protein
MSIRKWLVGLVVQAVSGAVAGADVIIPTMLVGNLGNPHRYCTTAVWAAASTAGDHGLRTTGHQHATRSKAQRSLLWRRYIPWVLLG